MEFEPDPAEEARELLRQVYYAQRQFRRKNKRFTADLDSLGVEHRILRHYLWPPKVEVTGRLFEASLEEVVDVDGDGAISRWVIAQDSRLWKE